MLRYITRRQHKLNRLKRCTHTHQTHTEKDWIEFYNTQGNQGLGKHLGVDITDLNMAKKRVEMQHMAPTGLPHGGAISTLADTAIAYGAWLFRPKDAERMAVTDMNVKFLKSASVGDTLVAVAHQHSGGNLLQVWDATIKVRDSDLEVALIRGTAMNLYTKKKSTEWIQDKSTKLGLGFNLTKMTKDEIARKFDKHSEHWEDLVKMSKYREVYKWLGKNCGHLHNKNAKVLDLACGPGLTGKCIREHGLTGKITGVDISSGMLSQALKSKVYESVRLKDLDEDFGIEEKFDVVICCGTTELLCGPLPSFLSSVKQVLAPKGEAWITFQWNKGDGYNPTGFQGTKQYTKDEWNKGDIYNPTGFQGTKQYTKDEIESALIMAGLESIEIQTTDCAYIISTPTPPSSSPPNEGQPTLVDVPFAMVRVKHMQV